MSRKRLGISFIIIALAIGMAAVVTPAAQAAYTPAFSTLRIGLNYNTTVIPSANLQNAAGLGSGFEFGYYDGNREFVSIGARTGENAITMVMDRNMTWYPGEGGGAGEYREGVSGSVILGCFHIKIDFSYETFEQAKAAAEPYTDSFVKYDSGRFYVMISQYTTRAEAENAMYSRGLSGCIVDAGTSNTIAVVKTGTNQPVFEYDYGEARYLGVRPIPIQNENPESWFRGYKYCGGFQYARRGGELLTVVNYVEIEDYVKGILPYEMNNDWPIEALKAQACCSRSYAMSSLNKHSAHGFDLCTTEDCQVYCGREYANDWTDRAVNETEGMYVTYNDELCITYYASSNGGASENSENVWNETLPYLRSVIDPYEADVISKIPDYYWTVTFSQQQITQRLKNMGIYCSTIVSMRVSAYTPSGNVLSVTMRDDRGIEHTFTKRERIIAALGVKTQHFSIGKSIYVPGSIFVNGSTQVIDINSQLYAINGTGTAVAIPSGPLYAITGTGSIEIVSGETGGSGDDNGMINGVFTISGSGNGHSVGMSQWGAYSMAEFHGMTYIDIIKFYYTGVEIG